MRKYELFCLLKSSFDIEGNDQVISTIEKNIENFGGKILETNKAGRKRLAYEIDKNRDSFCVVYNIEIAPDKIKELKRYLKLNDNVLREYVSVLKPAKATKPAPKEAVAHE
ncbi:MAG: 30S ribosomal protein S6 [Candidatus Melainabacteria bacterium GWF2_37_15]|nr:MAG: 30S ribosomal protein S6 [Candidatus Melainabacteria bacterium GWF2_37_15]